MKKKILSLALTLALCLGLTVSSSAEKAMTYEDEFNHFFRLTNVQQVADDWNGLGLGLPITCYKSAEITTIADVTYFHALPIDEDGNSGEEIPVSSLVEFDYPPHPEKFIKAGAKITLSEPGWYQVFAGVCTNDHQPKGNGGGELEGVDFFITVLDEDVPTSADPQPTTPPALVVEDIPASGTAVASTQAVEVDGKKVEFQMYALLDANGNGTNYVKLRDLAHVLNGTAAQFAVGYSNAAGITLTSSQPYQGNGSEMTTPFSGDRAYTGGGQSVQVNGNAVEMTAINLLDDAGGGYNYFKLRDLGTALGFKVDWSAARGIYIETK
ncbi:hypothetical protein D1641_17235 [Colidextribacter sp. OB.20]|uniref:hypothetical protein n=1 Tax=Colidextribacter sp. OB.20 TaxID=2304568 RepID=UPI00136F6018|nr:hypothetical protein [Colidextribacter sp. OB.20]NBI11713.1 hypothetical protein [Colidextribacter sp. OB.20]